MSVYAFVTGAAGILVFLFVVRAVIRKIPSPNLPNQKKYFLLIDRIIICTFALSIVGIVAYAIVETSSRTNKALEKTVTLAHGLATLEERYKSLSKKADSLEFENAELREKIEHVAEAGLKARSAGFEVLSVFLTWDLTKWKPVAPTEKNQKRSQLLSISRRMISRAHLETTKFAATYATASIFDPDFSCKTHRLMPIVNNDPIPPGKESLRRWILEYDISMEPLFTPFEIVTETTGWNSLQNPTNEHEGTLVLYPTKQLSLEVIFPESKPPKPDSVECYSYPLGEGSKSIEPNPKLTSADGKVKWDVESPRLGYHYEIHWKW